MANTLFQAYKSVQIGDAAVSGFTAVVWETDTIHAYLIDAADDTIAPTTDQDLADIVAGAKVANAALANKTAVGSGGTLTMDADDTTLSSVSGDQSEQVVIARQTGTDATSLLICFFDTFTSGMPVTPNGGNIVLVYNGSGIFTW
jgi:hypothetical protein